MKKNGFESSPAHIPLAADAALKFGSALDVGLRFLVAIESDSEHTSNELSVFTGWEATPQAPNIPSLSRIFFDPESQTVFETGARAYPELQYFIDQIVDHRSLVMKKDGKPALFNFETGHLEDLSWVLPADQTQAQLRLGTDENGKAVINVFPSTTSTEETTFLPYVMTLSGERYEIPAAARQTVNAGIVVVPDRETLDWQMLTLTHFKTGESRTVTLQSPDGHWSFTPVANANTLVLEARQTTQTAGLEQQLWFLDLVTTELQKIDVPNGYQVISARAYDQNYFAMLLKVDLTSQRTEHNYELWHFDQEAQEWKYLTAVTAHSVEMQQPIDDGEWLALTRIRRPYTNTHDTLFLDQEGETFQSTQLNQAFFHGELQLDSSTPDPWGCIASTLIAAVAWGRPAMYFFRNRANRKS